EARGILRPHGSPKTPPSIAGFCEELAPLGLGGEQCDHLVNLCERVALLLKHEVIKGHGFLPFLKTLAGPAWPRAGSRVSGASRVERDLLAVAEPDRQCPAVLLRGALGHAKATRPWASRSCRAS